MQKFRSSLEQQCSAGFLLRRQQCFSLNRTSATSPAWAPYLDSVNDLLTTCTLLIGVVLGLIRLVAFWRNRRRKGGAKAIADKVAT